MPDTLPHPAPPAKRPRGRPRVFDDERRHTLCELIAVGFSRKAAARHVGVPPSSVVHAAKTDPAFADRLRDAQRRRARRPPELIDVGRPGWRAAARLLERRNPEHFRLPKNQFERWLSDPRFKQAVARIVRKLLARPSPLPPVEEPPWRREGQGEGTLNPSERGLNPAADYCSKNPQLTSAACETKTILPSTTPIIVSQTPRFPTFHPEQKQ